MLSHRPLRAVLTGRWEPYQMTWCEKNKGAKGTPEYLSCLG